MDRSRGPETTNAGGHRYTRAAPDYAPTLAGPAPDLGQPLRSSRSRELTSSDIHRILDGSQEIGNGRGRSFLDTTDPRNRRFAERLITHPGGYAVLVKPTVLQPEPGVRSRPELGMEIGGRQYDRFQFADIIWGDQNWDRGEPKLGQPGWRPRLDLLMGHAGRPFGGRPPIAQDLARNLGCEVNAPYGGVWLENGLRYYVLPTTQDWRGNDTRATRGAEVPEGESSVVMYDPWGHLFDVVDTRPSGIWFRGNPKK